MNAMQVIRPRRPMRGYAEGGEVDNAPATWDSGQGGSSPPSAAEIAANGPNDPTGSRFGNTDLLSGAAPNTTALAQAYGVDPGTTRGVFGLATGLMGAPGMALGALNAGFGAYNAIANTNALAAIGAPMSFGQTLGAILGSNSGYNGTLSGALNAIEDHGTAAQRAALASPNQNAPVDLPSTADFHATYGYGSSGPSMAPAEHTLPAGVQSVELADPAGHAAPSGGAAQGAASGGDAGGSGGGSGAGGGPGGDNGGGTGGNGAEQGGGAYAVGGLVTKGITDRSTNALRHSSGLVMGTGDGAADGVTAVVPEHSYIMPADVVSGMGDGNTMGGAHILDQSFANHRHVMRSGGHRPLKVKLSPGEYAIHPDHVTALGGGDLAKGHAMLAGVEQAVRARMAARMGAGR